MYRHVWSSEVLRQKHIDKINSFSFVLYQDDEQPDDLSFPDNNEDDDSLENLKLLWHGEIEEKLDKAHPLLCTMIYDSCR